MTLQELEFVRHYLGNGGNGTEAALAAGYAPKGCAAMAVKLLGRPAIAAELARVRIDLEAKMRGETLQTVEGIRRYWADYILGDVEPSATPADRLRASGMLGKSIGALRDSITGDLVVRVVYEDEGAAGAG